MLARRVCRRLSAGICRTYAVQGVSLNRLVSVVARGVVGELAVGGRHGGGGRDGRDAPVQLVLELLAQRVDVKVVDAGIVRQVALRLAPIAGNTLIMPT